MRIRIIDGWDEFVALEKRWNKLLAASADNTIFMTHQWFAAFIAAFTLGGRMAIVICYEDDEIVGILPLFQKKFTFNLFNWQVLASLTNYHSQKFGFIFKKGRENLLPQALLMLNRKIGWDLIQADFVDSANFLNRSESMLSDVGLIFKRVPAMESRFIRLEADFETYYQNQFSKSLRKSIERAIRKIEQHHKLTFESIGGPALKSEDLLEAYEIEASGWKGRNNSAIIQHQSDFKFYSRLAWAANITNWFALRFLKIDAKRVAFSYDLHYNGSKSGLKTSYDENFRKYTPGNILMMFSIREAYQRGDRIFDLLGPAEAYKTKIAKNVDRSFKISILNNKAKSKLLRMFLFDSKTFLARIGLKEHIKRLISILK